MTNERFDELFGGPAAPARRAADAAPHGPRGLDPGGDRGGRAAADPLARGRDRAAEPVPGRRRGAQLRRQRQGPARRRASSEIWIQPAAGDAGGALGAALAAYHQLPETAAHASDAGDAHARLLPRPEFAPAGDRGAAARRPARASERWRRRGVCSATCVDALADGKAVGWFQGRMEFGPRALGGRSILGDPRSPSMQTMLNLKVKYRESLPPVRAVGAARGRRRLVRARRRQPVHAAGRRRRGGPPAAR